MKRFGSWFGVFCFSAAVSLIAAPTFAQMRVGGDGHATDANPEVGSGGYNPTAVNTAPTGNDITYGNVTNGFAFRGRLPFNDPSGFGEVLPGEGLDAFVRDSTGVPTMSHPTVTNPAWGGPQVFYSKTDSPTIPTGFSASATASGNYLATPAPSQQDLSVDLRLGAPLDFSAPLPKPGELLVPGQVDPTAQANPANPTPPTYFMASPLYGVRQYQSGTDNTNTSDVTNPQSQQGQSLTPLGTLARPNAEQQRILQMRQELAASANLASKPLSPLTPGATTPGSLSQNPNQPLAPLQVASATPIQPTDMTAIAGNMSTAPTQGLLPAAGLQSTQIAELQKRMDQYNKAHPASDEDANKQFLADLQARHEGQTPTDQTAGGASTPGLPGTPGAPGEPSGITVVPTPIVTPVAAPLTPSAPPPTPMQIKSLAEGVSSKSLADLIHRAEDQTTKGEYAKSIEAYDEAEAVAPNNALIPIGRANAELGGSYYRQAELDLRSAFKEDSSVLLAQYDLHGLLGTKRLTYVVTDLKQLASDEPQNPTPVFLLAYIAYNTHHEDRASGWLDVASRRAGGDDDVIPMLKKYWTFTASTPATQP